MSEWSLDTGLLYLLGFTVVLLLMALGRARRSLPVPMPSVVIIALLVFGAAVFGAILGGVVMMRIR